MSLEDGHKLTEQKTAVKGKTLANSREERLYSQDRHKLTEQRRLSSHDTQVKEAEKSFFFPSQD